MKQQTYRLRPPPNLFTTAPPTIDWAVGSTFMPAPGVSDWQQPISYTPPSKPVMPASLAVAASLLGAAGLLVLFSGLVGIAMFGSSGTTATIMWSALFQIAAAVALVKIPGAITRLIASVAAAWWVLTILGVVVAVPVLLLLWSPSSVKAYYRDLKRFRHSAGGARQLRNR